MTGVLVTRYPFGTTQFSEAVCDVFEADTLTVSCSDPEFDRTHGPLRVFKPGTWLDAVVIDERGNPLYGHVSAIGQQQFEDRRAAGLTGVRP